MSGWKISECEVPKMLVFSLPKLVFNSQPVNRRNAHIYIRSLFLMKECPFTRQISVPLEIHLAAHWNQSEWNANLLLSKLVFWQPVTECVYTRQISVPLEIQVAAHCWKCTEANIIVTIPLQRKSGQLVDFTRLPWRAHCAPPVAECALSRVQLGAESCN